MNRTLSKVATPLLFAYIAYNPAYVDGLYPERVVPGLVFGLVVLAIALHVEADDAGGDGS